VPVLGRGRGARFAMGVGRDLVSHRRRMLKLAVIGLATLARRFRDSAAELIFSAVLAGLGIALIQALMPALIKSRFKANVSSCMGLYVTAIMGGAALAAPFRPVVLGSSGSWRFGLAVWSLLPLPARCFWFAQRRVWPPEASPTSRLRLTFSHQPPAC
ncbi:MFS transporter, partial [Pseudomonas syringae]